MTLDRRARLRELAALGGDPAVARGWPPGRCRCARARGWLIHPKDLGPGRGFRRVGAGTFDWDAMRAAARAVGSAHRVVEHDTPRGPAASARARLALLPRSTG